MSRSSNCFLCSIRIPNTQIQNIDRLFYIPPQTSNQTQNKSFASILSDALKQDITETNAHSNILCKKCQRNCTEYERVLKRLETLRETITNNYNETMSKYAMETVEIDSENFTMDESDVVPKVYTTIDKKISQMPTTSNSNKSNQVKKVMLIKSDDDLNPYFTISDINESGDDNQTIHTVFLKDMGDTTEFEEGGASTTNYELEVSQDASEQYVIGNTIGESGFDGGNDDASIDSNQYQYVFQDGSNDALADSYEIDVNHVEEGSSIVIVNPNTTDEYQKRPSKKTSIEKQRELFVRDGDQFQCLLCQPLTNVIYDTKTISIHLKTDHNERVYVCSICGLDFRKRNPYNAHMSDHMNASAFECEICKIEFDDAKAFRLHRKTHNVSEKIWSCTACDKKYNSKNLLDEHMNMHTGERPYKCPHCVKDFASKYTLTAHMKIHSDRKRPYECKECGKSFFSNQNLTQHSRTHTGVKEYECHVCGKKFGSPHNLEVHKIVHTGHKPFICRTCGKAFARRAEIKDHERTHTGERPYKCDMCDSSFAQRSNLMSHKRATHLNDKRYKCDTCNRSFKRRRLLDYHIKATHTGERPYKCSQCNSTFVYPEHYKKHIRIHTGVKPFSCEVCGKTFNSRDNRNAHRYVHSDKKPYECLVCHQGFMRRPLLFAHMEARNHLNDKIIINKPRIPIKKDLTNLDPSQSTGDNEEIVYLNLNDDDLLDEGEYSALKEEHIVDDDEIDIDDEQLSAEMEEEEEEEEDSTTFIETTGTDDALTLSENVDDDNYSWIGISS